MKIIGSRLILRDEHRNTDDDDFFRWLNLEEWNYHDEPDKAFKRISRQEFDNRLIEKLNNRDISSKSHNWQIDTTDGRHIGWVNFYNLEKDNKQAYVGICLPENEIWGQGYGTEALCLLLDHLFDSLGLEEIRTATWTGNKRMVRCAEKSGFKNFQLMPHRTETSVRGEHLERIEFSMTRAEWYKDKKGGPTRTPPDWTLPIPRGESDALSYF